MNGDWKYTVVYRDCTGYCQYEGYQETMKGLGFRAKGLGVAKEPSGVDIGVSLVV